MKPTLLLFRLDEIGRFIQWDKKNILHLQENCVAIAVSGGTEDLMERRCGKSAMFNEKGTTYPLKPFFSAASNWVVTGVIWSLLGPGGRLYPIYRASTRSLEMRGFAPDILPDAKFDVLASLKFQSLKAAQIVDWTSDFLTCFSDGLGLGFWGDMTELEKKLICAPDFTAFNMATEWASESFQERLQKTHPYLFAFWQEYGFEWLLQNASLIMRPCGWEGEDALFLSTRMTHNEMIDTIHKSLSDEIEIWDYDGDDPYLRWVTWQFGQNPKDKQWP